jgi:cytochrome c peroxidase
VYPTQAIGNPGSRALFTDFQYHNLGVGYRGGYADTGRHEQTRNSADWGAFRTPSLRHSAKSPPYMHNGSFATLEEVVEFYNAGGVPNPNISPQIKPLGLSVNEKSALVAFLRAIAD